MEDQAEPLADGTNPFVGPRSLVAGEPLYGRARELDDLVDLWIAERIVLLYSPSGAGKTSLLQAGLLPRLAEDGFTVLPLVRVALELGPDTMGQQAAGVNRYAFSSLLNLEDGIPPDRRLPLEELQRLSLTEYLVRQWPISEDAPELALVFDQFEELLVLDPTDVDAKREYMAQVAELLRNPQIWALFSMREDRIAGLDPYLSAVPTRLSTRYRLDLLSAANARHAIRNTSEGSSVAFTGDAARKVVDDLRLVRVEHFDGSSVQQPGPTVEPVQLQVVCRKLWSDRRHLGAASVEADDVSRLGDVDSALRAFYTAEVGEAARMSGLDERQLRDWFQSRLITDQGFRAPVLDLPEGERDAATHAVRHLVDAHLVRSESRGGVVAHELAHDRLVGPVLAANNDWYVEHIGQLERHATEWDAAGRTDMYLLLGSALDAALDEADEEVSVLEREFLDASVAHRERVERERRQARRLRVLVVAVALVAAVAAAAAILAVLSQNDARDQRNEAQLQETLAAGVFQSSQDAEFAVEAAARAADLVIERGGSQEAIDGFPVVGLALYQALNASAVVGQLDDPDVVGLGFDQTGQIASLSVAGATEARTEGEPFGELVFRRWGTDLQPTGVLERLDETWRFGYFDVETGALVQDAEGGGFGVFTWHVPTGEVNRFEALPETIFSISVSDQAGWLAVADDRGTVLLYSLEDPGAEPRTLALGDPVHVLEHAAGGTRLLAGLATGEIAVIDPDEATEIERHAVLDERSVDLLAVDQTGVIVAVGTLLDRRGIVVVNLETGSAVTYGQFLDVTALTVDSGNGLLVGADQISVDTWRLDLLSLETAPVEGADGPAERIALAADPNNLLSTNPIEGEVSSVDVDPTGQRVLAARLGSRPVVWALPNPHPGSITGVTVDPAGRLAASADRTGILRLWTLDGVMLAETETDIGVVGVAFTDGGDRVALAGLDPETQEAVVLVFGIDDDDLSAAPVAQRRFDGVPIALSANPAGTELAVLDTDRLRSWDPTTDEVSVIATADPGEQFSLVAVSPDGEDVAVFGSTESGSTIRRLAGGEEQAAAVDFLLSDIEFRPGGQLWGAALDSGVGPFTESLEFRPIPGFGELGRALAFDATGELVALAKSTAFVDLWVLDRAGTPSRPREVAYPFGVFDVALTADAEQLVASTAAGTVVFSPVQIADLLALARTRSVAELPQATCNDFFGEELCE